ncbi:MAG: hypothetical protein JSR28_20260 [Proteobacteria bacterium]|nr:hypothetical protein [Pseudomonadota bacterium]
MAIKWAGSGNREGEDFEILNSLCAEVDTLMNEVRQDTPGYFPFFGNERASVSQFVAASARLGWLPLAEWRVKKRKWDIAQNGEYPEISNLSCDEIVNGYQDFWCSTKNGCFAIEFKQISISDIKKSNLSAINLLLKNNRNHAISEMKRYDETEADHIFCCSIIPVVSDILRNDIKIIANNWEWLCHLTSGDADDGRLGYEVYFCFASMVKARSGSN